MNYDLIYELDYGTRTPVKNYIKELLSRYNGDTMPLICIFVNNIPYNLEFFLLINFETDDSEIAKLTEKKLKELGGEKRTDLTLKTLTDRFTKRMYNSSTFLDAKQCELVFESMFAFPDKEELRNRNYEHGHLKTDGLFFLSHKSEDKLIVEKLIGFLQRQSVPIWFDKFEIDYGDSLVEKIQEGIGKSIGVIFWVTRYFLASNWCRIEMETFLTKFSSKRNIKIISVKHSDIRHDELPLFLQNLKYYEFNNDTTVDSIATDIYPSIRKYIESKD